MDKPSSLWNRLKAKLKTYTLAAAMFFGGTQAVQAQGTFSSNSGKPLQKKTIVNKELLIDANGVKLDPTQCQPYDVVNAYLSSGKADITDGRLPMNRASTLGEFMLDINRELPGFIKANSAQFPELKKAAVEHGIRSVAFLNAWRSCCKENPQAFKQAMFETRWNNRYAKIFNDLHQNQGFPLITQDNYNKPENFAYSMAVISSSGLNMNTVRKIFNNARKAAPQGSLTDIAAQTYNERIKMFPKYAKRFSKEKQNCLAIAEILNNGAERTADFMQAYTAQHDEDTRQYINSSLNRVRQNIRSNMSATGVKTNTPAVKTTDKQSKSEQSVSAEKMNKTVSQTTARQNQKEQSAPKAKADKPTPNTTLYAGLETPKIKLDTDLKATLDRQINEIAHATYNGCKVDFRTLQPQQIGQIFESKLNPCITDGRRHISRAHYLGLYQINLATTMPGFVKQYAAKYPKLKAAKDKHGIKSESFLAAWKEYSTGKQGEEFADDQFKFMWKTHYQRTFDKLAATGNFPKITLENYKQPEYVVYVGTVKSCVNQNPKATPGIFKTAYSMAQRHNHVDKPSLQQVINYSYSIRKARWGLRRRYNEESKLCQDYNNFCQTVAKLQDTYVQKQLYRNALAQNKQKAATQRFAMYTGKLKPNIKLSIQPGSSPKNLKELMTQRKRRNRT